MIRAYPIRKLEVITLGGEKFLVHHIVNPMYPSEKLAARLKRDRPNVVVFGHTHKRYSETVNGVLYFNPGYAGRAKHGSTGAGHPST